MLVKDGSLREKIKKAQKRNEKVVITNGHLLICELMI